MVAFFFRESCCLRFDGPADQVPTMCTASPGNTGGFGALLKPAEGFMGVSESADENEILWRGSYGNCAVQHGAPVGECAAGKRKKPVATLLRGRPIGSAASFAGRRLGVGLTGCGNSGRWRLGASEMDHGRGAYFRAMGALQGRGVAVSLCAHEYAEVQMGSGQGVVLPAALRGSGRSEGRLRFSLLRRRGLSHEDLAERDAGWAPRGHVWRAACGSEQVDRAGQAKRNRGRGESGQLRGEDLGPG